MNPQRIAISPGVHFALTVLYDSVDRFGRTDHAAGNPANRSLFHIWTYTYEHTYISILTCVYSHSLSALENSRRIQGMALPVAAAPWSDAAADPRRWGSSTHGRRRALPNLQKPSSTHVLDGDLSI